MYRRLFLVVGSVLLSMGPRPLSAGVAHPMNNSLRGSVVITGASTGIGAACALHLDQLGFQVFAGVRTEHDGRRCRLTRPLVSFRSCWM